MIGIIIGLAALAVIIWKLTPVIFKFSALKAYNEGKNNKALALYKTAAYMFGRHTQYLTEYALLLMRLGDFSEAQTVLTSIVTDRSVDAKNKINVRTYRAMVYYKQGMTEDALEEMEDVYASYKTSVVYGMLGFLRQLSGNAELEFCEEAYNYNSDDRDICDNMLVAYTRSGNFDKAKEVSEKLMEKYPTFVEAFYHTAELDIKMGNLKAAKEHLEKIDDCKRSMLTTVSEEAVAKLKEEVKNA